MQTTYAVSPLLPGQLDQARRAGEGEELLRAGGGEPLRCCLRDAVADEELILFGYAPPLPAASPYRELGPVFAHAATCTGPDGSGYPGAWRSRPQVLRAYDADGRIHPASRVHDGTRSDRELREVLAADGVVEVPSRNVVYGCFMFAARRTGPR